VLLFVAIPDTLWLLRLLLLLDHHLDLLLLIAVVMRFLYFHLHLLIDLLL